MSQPTSLEEANKIILRQQADLLAMQNMMSKSADLIRTQHDEIVRLTQLCQEHEHSITKMSEIIYTQHEEITCLRKIDARKRGERID